LNYDESSLKALAGSAKYQLNSQQQNIILTWTS